MKHLTYYQLANELDKAIKHVGNDIHTACLYRSFAGAYLLGQVYKDVIFPCVGILRIQSGDLVNELGPRGKYTLDEDPQRALDNGEFHTWIERRPSATIVDLSARHFEWYDTKKQLGSFKSVPTELVLRNKRTTQIDQLSISYFSSESLTLLITERNFIDGMPEQLWWIAREAGRAFGITVPSSARRKKP